MTYNEQILRQKSQIYYEKTSVCKFKWYLKQIKINMNTQAKFKTKRICYKYRRDRSKVFPR